MLERLYKILDKDIIDKIRNTTVLIIGLGGVGGSSLESISRFGINNLILVDNDIIDESNINRQILSLNSNIGHKKVDIARSRVLDINKDCNIITIDKFITKDNIDELFKYNIDYIIDCCDTISTKILLIEKCLEKNIKIISCMGTGNKFHPELLEITDLSKTSYDPIAKVLRPKFKGKKVKVVSSKEKSIKTNGVGSNSLVPNAAGILLSSYVINDIIDNR